MATIPIDDAELERTLLHLEHEGWQALSGDDGAAFYEHVLSPHSLMVFPGIVLPKERAVDEIEKAPPWAEFHIDEPLVVRLTEQSAVLTYTATARREGRGEYHALMSSVYVQNDGDWKLAFHQQTPIGDA